MCGFLTIFVPNVLIYMVYTLSYNMMMDDMTRYSVSIDTKYIIFS